MIASALLVLAQDDWVEGSVRRWFCPQQSPSARRACLAAGGPLHRLRISA